MKILQSTFLLLTLMPMVSMADLTLGYDASTNKWTSKRSGETSAKPTDKRIFRATDGERVAVDVCEINLQAYKVTIKMDEVERTAPGDYSKLVDLFSGTAAAAKQASTDSQKASKSLTNINISAARISTNSFINTNEIRRLDEGPRKQAIRVKLLHDLAGNLAIAEKIRDDLKEATKSYARGFRQTLISRMDEDTADIGHLKGAVESFKTTEKEARDFNKNTEEVEPIPNLDDYGKEVDNVTKAIQFVQNDLNFCTSDSSLIEGKDSKITVTIEPKDEAHAKDPDAIHEKAEFVVKGPAPFPTYSVGMLVDRLSDAAYQAVPNANSNPQTYTIKPSTRDNFKPMIGGLYHAPLFESRGLGVALSLGAGLKDGASIHGYAGLSFVLGSKRAAIITIGASYAQVARLDYAGDLTASTSNTIATKNVVRGGLFFGITLRQ